MTEFETVSPNEEITLPVEEDREEGEVAVPHEDNTPPSENWEKRCLEAEAALADSLEFASMYAAVGGDPVGIKENAVYQRFVALRALGLTVKEAFCAADSAREGRVMPVAGKDHLVTSHTRLKADAVCLTGDEMALAKELLGEDYSSDELIKLYRRVAK